MPAAPPTFALRISIFYAASFVIGGIVVPFLPVWLKYRGFTPELISACLALPLFARLIFTPIGSWVADRAPNRRFAIVLFAILALACFVPAVFVSGPVAILILTGLAISVTSLIQPATDALALTGYRRFGLDYGTMRVWGSISFVAVSLVAGAIVGWFGEPVLTLLLVGGYAIAAIAAFFLPVTPPIERAMDDAAKPATAPVSVWSVLAKRSFLAILISTSLIQASHGVFYGFSSIHWASLGFSGSEIGALWAIGVIAEVLMLRFSGRFRWLGAEGLIIVGAIGAIVRWTLYPFITHFAPSLLLQTLHGLTFAAAFVGMQMGIARDVDEERTASAQGACQVAAGLLMALTTLAGGPLYVHFQGGAVGFMTIFPVMALGVLFYYRRFIPKVPGRAG
ncbi:hypothetical protein C3941_12575 [Kaistia algarum]|uniref:MFS transporter n=1 Tax=Kaistia algarum TaxID=2083279 RepID=UPI000CE732E9|nr:MFS transporter [Kaistia algarum]MCX5515186.1 MFS transporter [Kaistia algarum]PPE79905.1 hypothetical protein C3941_12575 [Kaistia algarum]